MIAKADKENILVPYLAEQVLHNTSMLAHTWIYIILMFISCIILFNSSRNDGHWILILILLCQGQCYFFDSKRHPNKNWTALKSVLNDALRSYYRSRGTHRTYEEFMFHTSFCCKEELHEVNTNLSSYYVMSLMDDYVRT